MSCSLWRWTEACEGKPCVGDCDLCDRNMEDEDEDIEQTIFEGNVQSNGGLIWEQN